MSEQPTCSICTEYLFLPYEVIKGYHEKCYLESIEVLDIKEDD